MNQNWMMSIGLDIGTSTTKLIISRLLIDETKNRFSLPGVKIIDRQIHYTSQIYTTPLINQTKINIEALSALLQKEYERSGVSLADVKAGAVIITGETARKENAESIIHYLAEKAGDFVVATAGNDLEGVLAGKGSGAMKRSNEIEGVAANVDIGGGTANVALFQHGKAIQTFTFHVGGRLIRLTETGEVHYVSDYIQPWLQANGLHIKAGKTITYRRLYEIGEKMGGAILSILTGKPAPHAELLLVEPLAKPVVPAEEVIFSGGVAKMMEQDPPEELKNVACFGDMGPLLAYAISKTADRYPIRIQTALETTRATVIGAGMQNTEVSGATVFIDESLLPIKNVPLLVVPAETAGTWEPEAFDGRLLETFQRAKDLYGTGQNPPFALALSHITYCTYEMLQHFSKAIHKRFDAFFPKASLVIVVCENDMAKALGQAMAKKSPEYRNVICLDQIDFSHGDYIDLGFPVAGEAISISVKTLAFS